MTISEHAAGMAALPVLREQLATAYEAAKSRVVDIANTALVAHKKAVEAASALPEHRRPADETYQAVMADVQRNAAQIEHAWRSGTDVMHVAPGGCGMLVRQCIAMLDNIGVVHHA